MAELTQEYLKAILHYSPKSGIFTWIKPDSKRMKIGDVAGSINNGYIRIRINWKRYSAHRLAFLYMTGKFPVDYVDHINQVKDNNKFSNLRECSTSQNFANVGPRSDNTSGYKGVHWHKNSRKWLAQIGFGGKTIYIGYFTDKREAAGAYKKKALELFGEFATS